ncbi:anthranilate synthase component I family protein [Flagellimonas beolgyonensis]|uniref:anthranilate synthase component I family protein n=1 Tax=Flagellimonas beolgyonensis TaxID=864064 RepID=UPI000F8C45BB|nr:chorismate-binding protein [Allomuricauda beolgyonensis]
MRTYRTFRAEDPVKIKQALLGWSKSFDHVVWLDSNNHTDPYSTFEACLAIGKHNTFQGLDELKKFTDISPDWLFGYFSYDLKNEFEDLVSENHDELGFPNLYFYQPLKLIFLKGDDLHFLYLEEVSHEIDLDFKTLYSNELAVGFETMAETPIKIKMRIHKDAYFEKAYKFLEHIHRGDIYEANFCQEFFAEEVSIDPWDTHTKLNAISEPPFSAFMRLDDRYLMCASPERYLKKMGTKVISQPIKGTAKRGQTPQEDEKLAENLAKDEKERAENIMIADLVRNDLSKSAKKGSVTVAELCKVYTYKQVHQMISTIVSEVDEDKSPLDLIAETFPMGSMTGAPKVSAMKIIEELEETKRGLYSGAVGYFGPNGDFDFNVVIRSILYNAQTKYISYSVGSAITSRSIPENEYQECLLKAKAMRSVLEKS